MRYPLGPHAAHQYDAARILTLNLATCITEESKHEESAVLARLADCIRDMM
jgi:hypothetical protein